MSLHAQTISPVPLQTVQVAQAAFPQGNRYMLLRDKLGTIYDDALFADLFPKRGQPAHSPWQLALVTLMQFTENLRGGAGWPVPSDLTDRPPMPSASERRPAVLIGNTCWDWS